MNIIFFSFWCSALIASVLVLQIIWRPKRESIETLRNLGPRFDQLQNGQLRAEELLRGELAQSRQEAGTHARDSRTEIATKLDGLKEDSSIGAGRLRQEIRDSLKVASDLMLKTLDSLSKNQGERLQTFSEGLEKLSASNATKLEQVRNVVESKLSELRDDNGKRLEVIAPYGGRETSRYT